MKNWRSLLTTLQFSLANVLIVALALLLTLDGLPAIPDWLERWLRRPAPLAREDGQPVEESLPVDDAPTLWTHVLSVTSPIMDACGIWTGAWTMFAPNPDTTNHRIRAEVEFHDGRTIRWRSPDWPSQSNWQRFWNSRELEYTDFVSYSGGQKHLEALADHLARQHRKSPAPGDAPRRVRFVIEEAVILSPQETGWIPMSEPIPRGFERVPPIVTFPPPPKRSQP